MATGVESLVEGFKRDFWGREFKKGGVKDGSRNDGSHLGWKNGKGGGGSGNRLIGNVRHWWREKAGECR